MGQFRHRQKRRRRFRFYTRTYVIAGLCCVGLIGSVLIAFTSILSGNSGNRHDGNLGGTDDGGGNDGLFKENEMKNTASGNLRRSSRTKPAANDNKKSIAAMLQSLPPGCTCAWALEDPRKCHTGLVHATADCILACCNPKILKSASDTVVAADVAPSPSSIAGPPRTNEDKKHPCRTFAVEANYELLVEDLDVIHQKSSNGMSMAKQLKYCCLQCLKNKHCTAFTAHHHPSEGVCRLKAYGNFSTDAGEWTSHVISGVSRVRD